MTAADDIRAAVLAGTSLPTYTVGKVVAALELIAAELDAHRAVAEDAASTAGKLNAAIRESVRKNQTPGVSSELPERVGDPDPVPSASPGQDTDH